MLAALLLQGCIIVPAATVAVPAQTGPAGPVSSAWVASHPASSGLRVPAAGPEVPREVSMAATRAPSALAPAPAQPPAAVPCAQAEATGPSAVRARAAALQGEDRPEGLIVRCWDHLTPGAVLAELEVVLVSQGWQVEQRTPAEGWIEAVLPPTQRLLYWIVPLPEERWWSGLLVEPVGDGRVRLTWRLAGQRRGVFDEAHWSVRRRWLESPPDLLPLVWQLDQRLQQAGGQPG